MQLRFVTFTTSSIALTVALAAAGCSRVGAPGGSRALSPVAFEPALEPAVVADELAPSEVSYDLEVPLEQPSEASAERASADPASASPVSSPAAAKAAKVDASFAMGVSPPPPPGFNREGYRHIEENGLLRVADSPLSTFSIDVDTASYSNVRRILTHGSRPPAGAVRIEELVNYFDYDYPDPEGSRPFSVVTEVSSAPWQPQHELVHLGIQGQRGQRSPAKNLVFLLDVSGSMSEANKLPLLKRALGELCEQLQARDHVSIVVYAGASGVVLTPTRGNDRKRILRALNHLEAGGSTNGGEGIELAYRLARQHFRKDAVNRVILATDGDFNVGTTSQSELVDLVERERQSGVFLTVLGFGMGNYQDATLEQLADHGNGNYAYIDTINEARKVLVKDLDATLVTIAKDVKIQVEFNPRLVQAYRLIGYENRRLADRDFNDDTKDAGEIGAGHTVTALYEVVLVGAPAVTGSVDPLKYQTPRATSTAASSDELMTVKLRYKSPTGDASQLLTVPVPHTPLPLARTSNDFRFSAAVAAFGMLLRDSQYRGAADYHLVQRLAHGAMGRDPFGYRREFLGLVAKAQAL